MGRRVSAKQLAQIWIVTTERVGQLARAGKIHKGADGLFDLDEALTFRRQQIADHEVNTMLKSYGSRHGTVTRMKALDHLLSAEEVLADPTDPKMPEETISETAYATVNTMLLDIGTEAIGAIAYNVAKRATGRRVDDAVIQAVKDEMVAAILRMQQVAMRFGFLNPEYD